MQVIVTIIISGIIVYMLFKYQSQLKYLKAENERLQIGLYKSWLANHNLIYMNMLCDKKDKVEQYLDRQKFKVVAIYGMNYIGFSLVRFLKDTKIRVCYGLDRNQNIIDDAIEVRLPEKVSDEPDVIIVTAEFDYQEVCRRIRNLVDKPVIKLSNLLEEVVLMSEDY